MKNIKFHINAYIKAGFINYPPTVLAALPQLFSAQKFPLPNSKHLDVMHHILECGWLTLDQ